VFEDKGTAKPFIVLMHGDQRVDTKALAAHLGTKRGMLQLLISAVVWRAS
jgi:prolyl-tRNA editing enzyme YbaK/EbsC (Cys-tRNA(Pro) deacylase)